MTKNVATSEGSSSNSSEESPMTEGAIKTTR